MSLIADVKNTDTQTLCIGRRMEHDEQKAVLLTGANGFLGSYVLRSLVKRYHVVILIRSFSDISRIEDLMPLCHVYYLDQVELEDIFRKRPIDFIVHCATHYGRRDKEPIKIIEANLIYPLRLLLLAVRHKVSHFINTDTILDKRISQYSLSKKQFLDWLLRYKDEICVANVRLEHFFGPGDDDSKFVTRIISDCLMNVPRIPLTKGEQKRDFVYISDVVNALDSILDHLKVSGNGYFEYEIGSGCSISIRDFCGLIKRLAGNKTTHMDFGAIEYRSNEMMDSRVDTSKLLELGWEPRVTLESGLRTTIEAERRRLK